MSVFARKIEQDDQQGSVAWTTGEPGALVVPRTQFTISGEPPAEDMPKSDRHGGEEQKLAFDHRRNDRQADEIEAVDVVQDEVAKDASAGGDEQRPEDERTERNTGESLARLSRGGPGEAWRTPQRARQSTSAW